MGNQFIPQKVMDQIGMELPARTIEVEKGAIRKFADAIGEDNPLYRDEAYAKKSRYGSLIAPPTFIVNFTMELSQYYRWDFGRVGVHGGEEYEYYKPIKAGDTIICKAKIVDIYEKEGKRGGDFKY